MGWMCVLRRWSLWTGASLLVVLCAACSRGPRDTKTVKAAEPPVVAVAQVMPRELKREEVLEAEFRPFQVIDVHARVAGYLKAIYVDVGSRVAAGQTLAILEVPELADDIARARASRSRSNAEVQREKEELSRAEAQHQATHSVYERLLSVSKTNSKLIAQQELDDAQSRDLSSEASVSAARAALAAAQQGVDVSQSDVNKTQTMNDYTRITAPFSGVITKRYADTGAMIPAGTSSTSNGLPVVQLSQNTLLRLVLQVPVSIVSHIRLREEVDVRVRELNQTFRGKVSRFADSVNMGTRTMDTQVDVPNPNLTLIPGMYAEAVLTLDKRDHVLSVPLEGLNQQGNQATAYVVGPDNRISIRNVVTGLETAELVEVVSGLVNGDLVVTGNRSQLAAGQKVVPKLVSVTKDGEAN